MAQRDALLARLEDAEKQLNEWITTERPLEVCDELTELSLQARLAKEYREAVHLGDPELLEVLTRQARFLLLPKSDEDRLDVLLVFHSANDLTAQLEQMYIRFAEELRYSFAPVGFSDGAKGLCICRNHSAAYPFQMLKNETGVHRAGSEQCAVSALSLRSNVSSEGYFFEAFPHPDDRKFHRFRSCAKVSRDGLTCESLAMRSAFQNRNLALSALAARTGSIAAPSDTIRDYDFDRGILTDHRLDKCFSIGDLQPLFESLLLAE